MHAPATNTTHKCDGVVSAKPILTKRFVTVGLDRRGKWDNSSSVTLINTASTSLADDFHFIRLIELQSHKQGKRGD